MNTIDSQVDLAINQIDLVVVAIQAEVYYYCVVFLSASSMNVEIRSEGCDDPGTTGCGTAFIKVNSVDCSLHRRGFNVAVFTDQGMWS